MTGRPTRVILKTRGSRNSAETTVQRPINARSLKDQKCIIKTILLNHICIVGKFLILFTKNNSLNSRIKYTNTHKFHILIITIIPRLLKLNLCLVQNISIIIIFKKFFNWFWPIFLSFKLPNFLKKDKK